MRTRDIARLVVFFTMVVGSNRAMADRKWECKIPNWVVYLQSESPDRFPADYKKISFAPVVQGVIQTPTKAFDLELLASASDPEPTAGVSKVATFRFLIGPVASAPRIKRYGLFSWDPDGAGLFVSFTSHGVVGVPRYFGGVSNGLNCSERHKDDYVGVGRS